MKFAFMSFSCPELSIKEILNTANRFGYDGIELRLDAGHKHGVEVDIEKAKRETVKAETAASGIEICCLATSLRFANPETAGKMIEDSFPRIELASALDCSRIRIFGGNIPEAISREKAIGTAVDALSEVAPFAEKKGVKLCFETHDDWCAPEDTVAVLKKVDNPALMANWDIMHPVRVENRSIDEAFEVLKPWIYHVHAHDGVSSEEGIQYVPMGTGIVDHKRALERLQEIDYEGFVSGEWINWEPWEKHLPRELATMKGYISN